MTTLGHEHRKGCPALQAWDIPDACHCDYPLVARDENGRRVKRPKEVVKETWCSHCACMSCVRYQREAKSK